MGAEDAYQPANFYGPDTVNFSDTELTYHIRTALEAVSKGDTESYEQLVGVMHYNGRLAPDEVAYLETCLKGLSGAVTCIDMIHHRSLLSSIFGMSLWNYRTTVMDALVDLVVSLAATNGKYIDPCLNMLVNNFRPPQYLLNKLSNTRVLNQKQEVLSRVHAALEAIYDLVPLVPSRLIPILAQRMPTVHNKDHLIVVYVENLLKLESSSIGKVVGSMILMVVMERLRDLDVEIGWDNILQDESSRGIFDMELEDADDVEDTVNYEDEFPREFLDKKNIRGNIVSELLDKLMVITFEHLESCQNTGRLDEVFESLFESFENFILNTYKSKFAQFVMFYACSLDPENCGEKFACKLADIFLSSSKPPLTRMSAVAYLASYLSRGKFLSPSFVASMLKRLVEACAEYCRTCNSDDIRPETHRVFYCGCQAIMYVMCFRMRSISDVPRLHSQLAPLESVLKHKLNPLMVCLPSVVGEFLRQAKSAGLFTISETFVFDDMLESELSRAFGGLERLDMFFPFDPCLLKISESFIRPNFVYWSMVGTTYDEEDEDEDDDGAEVIVKGEDDVEEEEEEEEEEIEYSMNKMSITPKHSFKNKMEKDRLLRMPSILRPSISPPL
ncbi:PREDICTED: RNA polymerase I-specific transcription initiation factor RRN3 [Tarenaya hassleriana]|uniref:RNA polymerase I-specific transcription initiation factor RRN3 n=1 Tax=Tarenaya hassleriana TaxID=28532 RepID=UPI00053CA059|nr:PREDICTED: RNA polymerase I-specific transcription initiation factor RRN3 [Tarenaya hassleriana]